MSPSVTQAVLSLAPILIPLLLGVHAWRREARRAPRSWLP